MTNIEPMSEDYQHIHDDIIGLLETARRESVRSINALMTATYWEIGRYIVEFEQQGSDRAEYGQMLIRNLANDLTSRFGRGFSKRNLEQMRFFYREYPRSQIAQTVSTQSNTNVIVQTVSAQFDVPFGISNPEHLSRLTALAGTFPLPWSAYVRLMSVNNLNARSFYEKETLRCGWSVRQLDRQVSSQFYERTLLSHNKSAMLQQVALPAVDMTPEQAIRDPFVLEFLDLKDEYSESDLEEALINHLMDFMLELGDDFAFVGRQRRLRIDDSWFRIDLLFFHRRLRCLLIVDLKVGKFSYADAGQMNMYLSYAKEHWMLPGENPPVGLILCADKGAGEAHYALSGLANTVLAGGYKMQLPDEKALADELIRTQMALESKG